MEFFNEAPNEKSLSPYGKPTYHAIVTQNGQFLYWVGRRGLFTPSKQPHIPYQSPRCC